MNKFDNQPDPKLVGDSEPVWPKVIKGMTAAKEDLVLSDSELEDLVKICEARNQFGISKYGVPLSTNNGRDSFQDAFEESLDLVVYSFQAYMEQGDKKISLDGKYLVEELVMSALESMVACYKVMKFFEEENG